MPIISFDRHYFGKFRSGVIGLTSAAILAACNGPTAPELNTSHTSKASGHEDVYNAPADVLKTNFKNPPEHVKPWVYWYWISDHISKQGIENDLAAMQKQGINTALIGIIHLQGERGEVTAFSEEWWDHLRFAIKKAAEYNIDIGLFNSPGWSQSGGPWVSLDKSMRYLDSHEYHVSGSQNVSLSLDDPDGFFQDTYVLAFETPIYEQVRLTPKNTKLTASFIDSTNTLTNQNLKALIDGDRASVYSVPSDVIKKTKNDASDAAQLQLDFELDTPTQMRSIEIYPNNTFTTQATLLAQNKAGEFERVKSFKVQRPRDMASIGPDHDAPTVVSFPAVESKHFRLQFTRFDLGPKAKPDRTPGFKDIVLSKGYKLERYVEKKLAKVYPRPQPKFDSYLWPDATPADHPDMHIDATKVLDITDKVQNGTLNWKVPEGDWTIVRYFMRPTGTTNAPTSKETKGPEIDKLSKPIAQFHFDAYIGKVLDMMPPEDRTALKYAVVDSYEQGAQNWTDGFAEKFKTQFGYDPIPFLPVYSGRAVGSVEQSERFLWDMRRMVADRVSYEYAAGLRERANENGLKLWLENYGHWGFPGEFLQYGGQADIVSGEFWATGSLGAIELKAASSAAHIYGQKTVMSESFTAGRASSFINHPWTFKKRGDWSFVEGVNHTLLHVYIQQAYDNRFPGVNAWFGSEFNRNNTWFDFMGSWLEYIKRSNYMMQQGKYVADIMYFIGEDAPKMTGEISPALPKGYSYDFINGEVILDRLSYSDGLFRLPDGMTFKILVLPNSDSMRPAVLKKIQALVAEGGAVYGPKPSHSPSLHDFPHADTQVKAIANSLWQNIDGENITHARYGKGNIFYSHRGTADLSKVLNKIGSTPDVSGLPEDVIWSHRSSATHDIYFVANQIDAPLNIEPSFRISDLNRQPQRWDAVTGKTYSIAQYKKSDGRIAIPMTLQAFESSFFVFEKSQAPAKEIVSIETISHNGDALWVPSEFSHDNTPVISVKKNGRYGLTLSDSRQTKVEVNDIPAALTLNQPWQLQFEENRDVPTTLTLDNLVSLTELEPTALKYYSGRIVYKTQFTIDDAWRRPDQELQLDLGKVGVIARVKVNGKNLGELWSRPLTVNINDAIKTGENQLEIEVATTWKNRLLGDLLYPKTWPDSEKEKEFNTSTTFNVASIKKTSEPQASGLIGPVTIKAVRRVPLKYHTATNK